MEVALRASCEFWGEDLRVVPLKEEQHIEQIRRIHPQAVILRVNLREARKPLPNVRYLWPVQVRGWCNPRIGSSGATCRSPDGCMRRVRMQPFHHLQLAAARRVVHCFRRATHRPSVMQPFYNFEMAASCGSVNGVAGASPPFDCLLGPSPLGARRTSNTARSIV